jgi:hypothetical protein
MPVAITSWDVRVVSAMDVNTVIAYVPRWITLEFSDQLNDVGSGKITHDFKDPFFAEFESTNGKSLLTGPYALQILRNSTLVFSFFVEDVQVDRLAGAETVTISGRGIGAALEWAVVLPEGLSGTTRVGSTTSSNASFFDRKFPGYAWNVRCATTAALTATYTNGNYSTAHPGVGAQLQATSSGNINSLGIDGIQDLVIGDRVLVKNQANQAHNGIYWVLQTGSPSTVFVLQRISECDGSPLIDLTVGNAVFVQEGATNGYSAYSLSSNGSMTNSNQVGTNNLVFSPLTTGTYTALSAFWLLFKEADNGYEYSSVESEFGTEIQESGRGGPNFTVSWPLYLDSVIDANIGQLDSKGSVVQDGGEFTVPAGKTMLEVIKQVTDQTGLSWHFSPSGSVSFVVTPFTRNGVVRSVPFGTDRTSGSAAMLFTLPQLLNSDTKTSSTDRRTIVWGSDGRSLDRLESTNKSIYGIRESYFENTSSDAAAIANFTGSAMRKIDGGKISQTIKFVEQQGKTAWIDFSVGDKILVESAIGVFSEQIVSALSATVSASDEHNIEITLGQVFPDIASDLEAQAGFGSLNAATIASFSGTPPNINLSAPTPRNAVTSTTGMSNRVTVTWDNPNSGRVSKYEVAVYRQGTTKVPTSVVRRGNIVSATFSSPHALTNGMYINVTSDEGFGGFNIPLLNTSSSVVYYANSGPDYTATTSVGVAQVLEYTTVDVDGTRDTATIENLGAPGTTYSYRVTPYNEYGLAGEVSAAATFASSNEPFQLVGSAVQSASYSAGTSGWKISADGTAEFNGGAFSVTSIDIGTGSNSFHVNTSGDMWLGASASVSAPFRVSRAGVLTATTGTFSGAITGSTIDIGSGNTSFHVNTSGQIWSGNAAYASAPFKVNNDGTLFATSGTIGGSMVLSSSGTLTTGAGLGATTLGYSLSWSGGRSGIFSDGGGAGFASFTYGDISILTGVGGRGIIETTLGTRGYLSSFDFFTNANSALHSTALNVREGPPKRYYLLDNNDAATLTYLTLGGHTADVGSDRRLKSNIRSVSQESLDKFYSIKVHEWDWNENCDDSPNMWFWKDNPISIGVIADEIKEFYPYVVDDEMPEERYASVAYSSLGPQMICAILDLNTRIKELEARLEV